MYKVTEIYKENGLCLKDILKESIASFYEKYNAKDLNNFDNNANINSINKRVLSKEKENKNAYWLCYR